MLDCGAAARHLFGRRCRRTAVLPARIGAVVVVLALVAGTAACVLPPPPPPPSATEFVDPIYVYDPASTCRDAVITAPFVGPESCGAVVSITESLQQQRMADADAALTAGDQQTARQLAIDTGYRPEAADIYRPTSTGRQGRLACVLPSSTSTPALGSETTSPPLTTSPANRDTAPNSPVEAS